MRKILMICIAFVTILGFNACTDDDSLIFTASETEQPRIVTGNSIVTLDKDKKDDQAFVMVWEVADYSVSVPVKYTIEAAAAATDFKDPVEVGSTTQRSYSWTVQELNNLAIATGLIPEEEGVLEIRVKSSIGVNNEQEMISTNMVVLTVTPYNAVIPIKNLFLVGNAVDTNKDGAATNDDWNNDATNTYLFRDGDDSNIFYFQGYFDANEFKILEEKGKWQPQWGLSGVDLTNSTLNGGDPSAFVTAAAGYYSLELNIDSLTYTLTEIDASSAPTYATIGIIGDSTPDGWDADTDMTQSAFNPHIWYIEDVALVDGALKFRHSNDWPGNWGGTTALSGITTTAGDPPAIPVTAGTYDIWFNDLDGRYILVPLN